jgi:hypothetical protein
MNRCRVFSPKGPSRRLLSFGALLAGLGTLAAWPLPQPALSQGPESPPRAVNYGRPFEPPTRPAFIPLPPGAIEPAGWLRDWATTARDGTTGHMEEVDPAFQRAWAADYKMTGDALTYWDRGAWPYEGGGYWFDGLVKLGYCLHDDSLIDKAKSRLDPVLSHMNENGILFMWWLDRRKPADMEAAIRHAGGEANAWPIWANSLLGRALTGYHAASRDERVLRAMELAYGGDRFWTRREAPPTNLWPAFEAWTWTGNKEIQKTLTEFFTTYKVETSPPDKPIRMIDSWYNRLPDPRRSWYRQPNHGVFFNETTIPWALGYLWTGDQNYLEAPCRWYDIIERGDDGMQPHGLHVCDENSGPTGSLRGTETCSVSGYIWSQIVLLRVGGQGIMADRVERALFNAAPGAVTRDFKAHVYHQTPNRINRDIPGGGPFHYARTHFPLCCTAASNRFLPNYLTHMWLATYDNGLAAAHYGPCKVSALVADHVPVEIACRTDYPFDEVLDITVKPAREATFPLSFRVPGWCRDPQITLNGSTHTAAADANGFVRIERVWKQGDNVRLRFPMKVSVRTGHDNNAEDTPYAAVSCGPLLFALGIPDTTDANTSDEKFKWNYALDVDAGDPGLGITVERRPMPAKWGWQLDAPLQLSVPAMSFDWKPDARKALEKNPVGPEDASPFQPDAILTQLPARPVPSQGTSEHIKLVPYGCAMFRTSMFPVTERAWKALEPASTGSSPREKPARS